MLQSMGSQRVRHDLAILQQQKTWNCRYLFEVLISILLGTHPEVEFLDHMVALSKDLNRHFSKDTYERSNKYMKKCSAALGTANQYQEIYSHTC